MLITNIDAMDKYLGLPSVVTKSKETFNQVKERVIARLGGWKEQLLSHAGYREACKIIRQDGFSNVSRATNTRFHIWGLDVPRKIQVFLWRSSHKGLPVGDNLLSRMPHMHGVCPFCGSHESDGHLFFECSFSRTVWFYSPLAIRSDVLSGDSGRDKWLAICQLHERGAFGKDSLNFVAHIMWQLWKARNSAIFDSFLGTAMDVCEKAKLFHREFHEAAAVLDEYQDNGVPNSRDSVACVRKGPPVSAIKINIDAATKADYGAIAAVARSSTGSVLDWRFKKVEFTSDALILESLAVKLAMELAASNGWAKCIIEGDNLAVINAIDGDSSGNWRFEPIIEDIKALSQGNNGFPFVYASRKCNNLAHCLARNSLDRIFLLDRIAQDNLICFKGMK